MPGRVLGEAGQVEDEDSNEDHDRQLSLTAAALVEGVVGTTLNALECGPHSGDDLEEDDDEEVELADVGASPFEPSLPAIPEAEAAEDEHEDQAPAPLMVAFVDSLSAGFCSFPGLDCVLAAAPIASACVGPPELRQACLERQVHAGAEAAAATRQPATLLQQTWCVQPMKPQTERGYSARPRRSETCSSAKTATASSASSADGKAEGKSMRRRPSDLDLALLDKEPLERVPKCPSVPRVATWPDVSNEAGCLPRLSMQLCAKPADSVAIPPAPPRGRSFPESEISLKDPSEVQLAGLSHLPKNINFYDYVCDLLDGALCGATEGFGPIDVSDEGPGLELPSAQALVPPSSRRAFARRLRPREAPPGEEPFPVDCLPSAPVAPAAPHPPMLKELAANLTRASAIEDFQRMTVVKPSQPRSERCATRPGSRGRLTIAPKTPEAAAAAVAAASAEVARKSKKAKPRLFMPEDVGAIEAPQAPPAPRASSAPCSMRLMGPPPLQLPLPGEEVPCEPPPLAPRAASRPRASGPLLQEGPGSPTPTVRTKRASSRGGQSPKATAARKGREGGKSICIATKEPAPHSIGGSSSLFGISSATGGVSAMALDLGVELATAANARQAPPTPAEASGFRRPPKLTKAAGVGRSTAGEGPVKAQLLPAIAGAPSSSGAVAWRVDLHRGESRRSRSIF